MNATDLQDRLVQLRLVETLLLSLAEIEEALHFCPTPEERHAAATQLAALYRCRLLFREPDLSQVLITRSEDPELPVGPCRTMNKARSCLKLSAKRSRTLPRTKGTVNSR